MYGECVYPMRATYFAVPCAPSGRWGKTSAVRVLSDLLVGTSVLPNRKRDLIVEGNLRIPLFFNPYFKLILEVVMTCLSKSVSGRMVYPYVCTHNNYRWHPSTPIEYYMWGIANDPEVWIFRDWDDQHALLGEMLCSGYRPKNYYFLEPEGTVAIPMNPLDTIHNTWGEAVILFAFNPVGIEFFLQKMDRTIHIRAK